MQMHPKTLVLLQEPSCLDLPAPRAQSPSQPLRPSLLEAKYQHRVLSLHVTSPQATREGTWEQSTTHKQSPQPLSWAGLLPACGEAAVSPRMKQEEEEVPPQHPPVSWSRRKNLSAVGIPPRAESQELPGATKGLGANVCILTAASA